MATADTTFPSIAPSSSSWTMISNTRQFTSPLTGAIQTASRVGSRWQVSMNFDNLDTTNRAVLQAFIADVQARSLSFYLRDFSFTRRADATGTALVNGAGQTGTSINTDGWSGTYAMRAGDYFEVNGELKMATADATVSAGAATISFVPELRSAPADNAVIAKFTPYGVFRLVTRQSGWTNEAPAFSSFQIDCIEDVIA